MSVPTVTDHRAYIAARITIDDRGCWVWQRARQRNGYGKARLSERDWLAHRLSYEAHIGPIPDGMQIDHLCRNRACVKPAHLEPVTVRQNLLRGQGVTAREAAQTHCIHGHPFTGPNLYLDPRGRRQCRQCRRAAGRRRYERQHR
jgi:hypothetical protein